MNEATQKKLGTMCLFLGTFFCPLGFDALFKLIMDWTGSYWITDLIFYLMSGLFLGFYFLLTRINKTSKGSSR